jgi:integrase
LGECGKGQLIGPTEEKITFEDLAADFLQDHALKGKRSRRDVGFKVANLKRHFGLDRALDITTPRIRAYTQARLDEGISPATVNRDLAALSRMFSLAVQAGILSSKPFMPHLQESQPRQGFLEHSEYLAIREKLPSHYQDILDFGYLTGWRKGEILRLEWRDVDRQGKVIRLRPENSKNRQGRTVTVGPDLLEVIERRWQARKVKGPDGQERIVPLVFHRKGKSIGDFRKTWDSACEEAGLQGKLFHDLRRTVVRNLVRAGVPERVAMSLTGHKTRSVFDRYNIVSEEDLRQASEKLSGYIGEASGKPKVVRIPKAQEGRS